MKHFFQQIFSIKNNEKCYKVITFMGLKLKLINIKKLLSKRWDVFQRKERIDNNLFTNLYLKLNYLEHKNDTFNPKNLFDKKIRPLNNCYLGTNISYINYLFTNLEGSFNRNDPREKFPNFFYICGIATQPNHVATISEALKNGSQVYIIEDCFLRSIFSHVYDAEPKYIKSIGFTIDDITHYVDASIPSRLEQWLNDKTLIITEEQKVRAKKCIDKIVKAHLSKYNNQPIYTPNIGREGAPKVLVVDQSYGDWSIIKGRGSEDIFELMLNKAIEENPEADIIVKTHPDTMSGKRGGYYTGLVQHDNIYPMTEPINPISLINYCDKVYVCTTQFGFEALMCNKEVHVFGVPFYQGWGLTIDEQICERRTNKRTLEELFYIAYIMYSHYVNPETKSRCEIEEAIDYLIKLRDEYFQKVICK